MVKSSISRHPPMLLDLPIEDEKGNLRCVIETPRGSSNKYRFNQDLACFELSRVLPLGMLLPFDFGFLPSTLGEDGDPLDVVLLLDGPAVTGCVLTVRIIGVIEAHQTQGVKDRRNDRLIAVPHLSRCYANFRSIDDVSTDWLKDACAFLENYERLTGKEFEVLGCGDEETARALIRRAASAFKQARRS